MQIKEEILKKGRDKWEDIFGDKEKCIIKYDGWLQTFDKEINECKTPIIDLGCGAGADTMYLLERGKQVIPCDYSINAIKNIEKNLPQLKTIKHFDMTKGLPFEDNFTDIIIADLSLHYFSEEQTFNILEEIKRVLKPNGLLIFRVNSTKDTNFIPNDRLEIEHNFYETSVGYKRFFDEEDINKFFSKWNIVYINEEDMGRYGHIKILWKGAVKVNK